MTLPALPGEFTDKAGGIDFNTYGADAAFNDRGDVVAAITRSGHGENDSKLWYHSTNTGWVNLSKLYGLFDANGQSRIANLSNLEITNSGLIYGMYRGYYSDPRSYSGFTIQAPVPEPSSLVLLALGAGGFIASRKRRRNCLNKDSE